ncbi:MAG TPA: hypothetical protein VHF89_02325 [Solirubrobacteraceae bacterium]|nr:hypothetical protein [Solirubrobacteraceae bacterium]
MRARVAGVAVTAAAMLLVPVAVAATPGTYEGWLYNSKGKRYSGTFTMLTVRDTPRGQRFRLSTYNMRLTCPWLDRNGRLARARFRFVHRGLVAGDFIDDTRSYPKDDPTPTHEVRIRGRFVGPRFSGRIRVDPAPGVTGTCTGGARVRVTRR